MRKNGPDIRFIGFLGITVMVLYIISILLPNNNIESNYYNYRCTYCQKVVVENIQNDKLNCLNIDDSPP